MSVATATETFRVTGLNIFSVGNVSVDVSPDTTARELFALMAPKIDQEYHVGIYYCENGKPPRGWTSLHPDRSVTLHKSGIGGPNEPDSPEESQKILSLPVTTFAPNGEVTWIIYRGLGKKA